MTFVPSVQRNRSGEKVQEIKKDPAMMSAKARIEAIWEGQPEDRVFQLEMPIMNEIDQGPFATNLRELADKVSEYVL